MTSISKSILRMVALTATILLFTANGTPSFASSYTGNNSPTYFTEEEGGQGEGEGEGGQEEGGQNDTSSVTSDQGGQQDHTELIRQYSARIKSALDELESHARAMIDAGNAGDRKKYDSESLAYDNADKRVDEAIASDDGLTYDEAAPIVDKAYDRLYSINKLREQAETALANSLGGAMDEDGNIYPLAKVQAKVSEVGKSNEHYDEAIRALGPQGKENENEIVYMISLFVGKKPVHLIGGLTKSVTIGIPNEKIGRTPVTSYYLWDDGDGNHGAPVAEKRGYFDKSTWCLTVKVSKYVTYYVVCGRPGAKGDIYADDVVAILGKKQNLTVDELREMISVVRLEDGDTRKAKALEYVKLQDKLSAVFDIALPDDVTLIPDAEVVADIVCPESAKKAVEVYRIVENKSEYNADNQSEIEVEEKAEWVGTFIADDEGKLQITSKELGLFVLCWPDETEEESPAVVTPTDTEPAHESSPVLPWVIGIVSAIALIGGAAFLTARFRK